MSERLTWLYGYTDDPTNAPVGAGIDTRFPVRCLPCGRVIAVVSEVPAEDWTGPIADARLTDVDRVAPWAIRHMEIVSQIRHAVVPSPFAALFSSDDALVQRTALSETSLVGALERLRGRWEWSVKGFVDAAARSPSPSHSPSPSASSGAAWLRARRDRARESDDRDAQIRAQADALAAQLEPLAVTAVQREGAVPEPGAEVAWSWAFLVEATRGPEFQATLESAQLGDGVRCVWSGPLPPYSFVDEGLDAA